MDTFALDDVNAENSLVCTIRESFQNVDDGDEEGTLSKIPLHSHRAIQHARVCHW